jgi:hypothetical protein
VDDEIQGEWTVTHLPKEGSEPWDTYEFTHSDGYSEVIKIDPAIPFRDTQEFYWDCFLHMKAKRAALGVP